MARPRARLNWWWLLAVPAAGLGALFAWLSTRPVLNVAGQPVFYPLVVFYYGGASAVSVILVLLGVGVLGFWVPQMLGRRPRWLSNGLATLLALAGGALACWASLTPTLAPYRHLDRLTMEGVTYQLGLRADTTTQAQTFWFVLCTCDESGSNCRCHDVAEIAPEAVTAPPELVAEGGRLEIRIGGTVVETILVTDAQE